MIPFLLYGHLAKSHIAHSLGDKRAMVDIQVQLNAPKKGTPPS